MIHPGKTMGTSMQETNVRNRILVCATTNQAVDSLAWKIKNQSLGTSGKVGDFKMVSLCGMCLLINVELTVNIASHHWNKRLALEACHGIQVQIRKETNLKLSPTWNSSCMISM